MEAGFAPGCATAGAAMSDMSTGATPRRRQIPRHRPRPAAWLWIAAAAGLATVAAVGVLPGVLTPTRVERAAVARPVPSSGTVLRDVPGTLWFGPAAPPVETFSRGASAMTALPNLNADARAVLADLDGLWTDGETRLHIDARRLHGRVERDGAVPPQPLIVRDIGDRVVVADIGAQRFVLLRRPDGVALSGATLPAPVELHRAVMAPRP